MSLRARILRCKVVNASVDWITATAASKDARDRLWSLGEHTLDRGQREGEHPTRWHAHGYSGWGNTHCSFGTRADGVCLRLSSHEAADQWLHCLSAAENVSRLDLAVDCELDSPATSLSRQIYRDVQLTPCVNGRPPQRRLIVSGDGGSTVYVGSRASEQMGRVYDKGVESKTRPAGHWWRWEVEYKGGKSFAVAGALKSIDHAGVFISATVATWFRQRSSHAFTTSMVPIVYNECEKPSTAEQQLLWLSRGVRPTVQRLVEHYGLERVLFALGLPPQSAVSCSQPRPTHKEKQCQQ